MTDITEQGSLPDYDRPPVVETILGVQFDRLLGFKNAHLGAFWKSLDRVEWPNVQDVPPLPPQYEQFEKTARWAKGIQFQLTQDPACRMQVKNKDGNRMVQLQNNRLHFNWLGESDEKYPRYEEVKEGFTQLLRRFVEFVVDEEIGDFRPKQWEVTYVNQIPKGTVWNTPGDWSFFKPLACVPTIEKLMDPESFGGEWHFVIPEQKGRLHVKWQHGVKPTLEDTESEFVTLVFTARGPMGQGENQLQTIIDGINLGRRTVVSSFKALMSDEGNQYWGLKQC